MTGTPQEMLLVDFSKARPANALSQEPERGKWRLIPWHMDKRPGLFKTFRVTVGNQSGLGAEGAVGFRVLQDGKPAIDSGIIAGRQPAKTLKVELGQARELTLETYSTSPGRMCHAVWAEPVLGR